RRQERGTMSTWLEPGFRAHYRQLAQAPLVVCLLAWAMAPAWAQEASPDRIVAEWMLRMGGSVVLEEQRRPITDLADLPTSDFRLHTLNFTGITQQGSALEEAHTTLRSCMSTAVSGTISLLPSSPRRCICSPALP